MTEESPVVLVVDDEPDVAETYQLWLAAEYDVRLAESGTEALEVVDEAVDVVLLDRMMPGMSGEEVLEEIRDRGLDCRVAIVSAVDPDFDIVEMGFDTYVSKPPTREELTGTVEDLLARGDRAETVQEYRSLLAKQATLEAQKPESELESSEEYEELVARIEALESDMQAEEDRFLDDTEFVGSIRSHEEQ